MHPVLIEIFGYQIFWFGFMMAAAFLICIQVWNRLGRPEQYPDDIGLTLAFWLMITGILGARAAYVIADLPTYVQAPVRIFQVWNGGLIYYGGFIGGTLGCLVLAYRLKRRIVEFGDLVITAVPHWSRPRSLRMLHEWMLLRPPPPVIPSA